MAEVYLDEDVSLMLAQDLRAAGHVVFTYREAGLSNARDALHLLAAAQGGRTVITCNRKDFELLHDAWGYWSVAWGVSDNHHGIIVPEQQVTRERQAERVIALLNRGLVLENRCIEWRGGQNGRWYEYGQGRAVPVD